MTIQFPSSVFASSELRTVKLHGALAEKYGSELKLSVTSPREAIRALLTIYPGFREDLREGHFYLISGDEENGLDIGKENIDFSLSPARPLHIIPAIEGRKRGGVGKLLAGIALIGLAFVTGGTSLMMTAIPGIAGATVGGAVMLAGIGMALGGLAMMLAPTPQLGDYSDREDEPVSYLMNGVVNNVEEGGAHPMAFGGPLMVGSHVISSGLDIDDSLLGSIIPPGSGSTWPGLIPGFDDWRDNGSPWGTFWKNKFNDQNANGIEVWKSGKGGGKARAAVEAATTVTSEAVARVLDLVSSGPIEGWADPDHPFRNVYLDETPVENSDGTLNFRGLDMHWRLGFPGQDYIPGFSQTENTVGVGVDVEYSQPATRTITSDPSTGLAINRVKVIAGFPALTEQDKATGDVNGATVSYRIGIIPNGGTVQWVVNQTLREKFTSPYQKAHTIELPDEGHPYQVRFQRMTPDSTSIALQNGTRWDAYVEIIDAKLSYPGSAVIGLTARASQFGDRIPSRGYMIKGAICEVPSNYDPVRRTYSGIWDGTFVAKWTNNPAWILWSILTNPDWGIGKRIPRHFIDKWGFYEIATYCDGFVSDGLELPKKFSGVASENAVFKEPVRVATRSHWTAGGVVDGVTLSAGNRVLLTGQNAPSDNGIYTWNGTTLVRAVDADTSAKLQYARVDVTDGTKKGRSYLQVVSTTNQAAEGRVWVSVHPRFQFNMWIAQRESVYKVAQTIASSFRGLLVWGRGMIIPTQDSPKTPRRLVTNANVIDGNFTYEGMGRKAVHTVALVTWTNPDDGWKAAVEVIENPELIAKYGWRPIDIFAPGCTNRAQARRTGSWALYTEEFESEFVTFKGSFEMAELIPGDVFLLADNDQIGIRMGGRLKVGPSASQQGQVTLDAKFNFQAGQTYTLYMTAENGDILQRTITNSSGETDVVTFSVPVTGNYPQSNYDSVFIITSSQIDPRIFRVMGTVENSENEIEIVAAEHHPEKFALIEEGVIFDPRQTTIYDSAVLPDPPTNFDMQRVTISSPGGVREQILVTFTKSSSSLVSEYVIRWRFRAGEWREVRTTTNNAQLPYQGAGQYDLIVYSVDVRGQQSVPISFSKSFVEERPIDLPTIGNFKVKGEAAGVSIFTGTTLRVEWEVVPPASYTGSSWIDPYFKDFQVDVESTSGVVLRTFYTSDPYFEITAEKYAEANGNVRSRDVRLTVKMRDKFDAITAGTTRTFTNPAPSYVDIPVTVSGVVGGITLNFVEPTEGDYAGIIVWASETPGFAITEANKIWEGTGQPRFEWTPNVDAYVRWAFYDDFGKQGLSVSPEASAMALGVGTGIIDTTPPSIPTSVGAMTEILTDPVTGNQSVYLIPSWTASPESDVAGYYVRITRNGGIPTVHVTSDVKYRVSAVANTTYTIAVAAYDRVGNASDYSPNFTYTTEKDSTPPAAPATPTATGFFQTIGLTGSAPADKDVTRIQVFVGTTTASGSATLAAEVEAGANGKWVYIHTPTTAGTYHFWVKAVDTSGNISAFSGRAQATTTKIGSIDLVPGLSGYEYGDYGVPANPTAVAPNLPATGNFVGRQAFNTNAADQRLYRYTSTGWSRSVPASDIAGQLTNEQIANLDALKLVGQITGTQIADNAITTPKILANAVIGQHIAGQTITASKLLIGDTSNMFPDPNLDDGQLTFASGWNSTYVQKQFLTQADEQTSRYGIKISTSDTIINMFSSVVPVEPEKDYYFAHSIKKDEAATDARVVVQYLRYEPSTGALTFINSYTIPFANSTTWQTVGAVRKVPAGCTRVRFQYYRTAAGGGALYASPIIRRATAGELIVDGTITGAHIQAGTITGDRIQAGTIQAAQIAAKAIVASKMQIGDTSNMIVDSLMVDDAAWTTLPAGISWTPNDLSGAVSTRRLVFTAAGEGVDIYSSVVPVEPGKDYFFSISALYTNGTADVVIQRGVWDGTSFTSTNSTEVITVGGASQAYSRIIRMNSNHTGVRLRISRPVGGPAGNGLYVHSPIMRRAMDGLLIVDGAIQAQHIQAGTITGDRIQAGTITGLQIAAETISTSKLSIGDLSNLIDGKFLDTAGWTYGGSGTTSFGNGDAANDDLQRIMFHATAHAAGAANRYLADAFSPQFAVEGGKEYTFGGKVRALATAVGLNQIYATWFDRTGAQITSLRAAQFLASGSTTTSDLSGKMLAPANAVTGQFRLRIAGGADGSYTPQIRWRDLYVRKAVSGELIVDGTITAAHILAGTITGDRIAANTIQGVHIAANTIRTTSLIVGASAENLVVNPSGREGADGWYRVEGATTGMSLTGQDGWGQVGRYGFWLIKNTTSVQTAWGTRAFPVIPGRVYSIRLYAFGNAATSNGMYHRIRWTTVRPANDTMTTSVGYTNLMTNGPVQNSVAEYTYTWTAPAGAYWASLNVYNWTNGPTELYFTDVEVKEQITGVSIADGSINAAKVETNSLTADKLKASNITVALGVGSSGKITIDGANNRILISD